MRPYFLNHSKSIDFRALCLTKANHTDCYKLSKENLELSSVLYLNTIHLHTVHFDTRGCVYYRILCYVTSYIIKFVSLNWPNMPITYQYTE